MALMNRVTNATHAAVTMGVVLSVDVAYSGGYNQTYGGGSFSKLATLRTVDATVTVTYLTVGAPANLDAAPATLTIAGRDDSDPTNGNISIGLPYMKPLGNAMALQGADASGFSTFSQSFQLAPGLDVTTANMKPTVA